MIVGGVIIPALVSLNTPTLTNQSIGGEFASTIGWITFGLNMLVALSVAIEQFFNYGECWRLVARFLQVGEAAAKRVFGDPWRSRNDRGSDDQLAEPKLWSCSAGQPVARFAKVNGRL